MAIQQLRIHSFRNLNQVVLEPSTRMNLVVGKNGSGKTSFLEAIYFLSAGKSFRTPHSHHLIQFEQSQFNLFAKVTRGSAQVPIGVEKSAGKTKIKIANDRVSSAATLASYLPVQIINPDSHKLIEEGPRFRRRFLEWGLFHVKPGYMAVWQNCRQVLKQRNAALKAHWKKQDMQQWNQALLDEADRLNHYRKNYLQELQAVIISMADALDQPLLKSLELRFRQGWPKDKSLQECLAQSWDVEQKKGFTQYGPHKADFDIVVNGLPAKRVVSRGQQKLITAILKIAQVAYLRSTIDTAPILLVDDLAAELDQEFRHLLIHHLSQQHYQVFVTTIGDDILPQEIMSKFEAVFHVEHGNVTRSKNSPPQFSNSVV